MTEGNDGGGPVRKREEEAGCTHRGSLSLVDEGGGENEKGEMENITLRAYCTKIGSILVTSGKILSVCLK